MEKRKVKLDADFALFLHHFPDYIQANVHLAAIEWKLNLDKESEISLKGKCFDVGKGN